ncbi:LysR family transcriptional regulator [Chryseolinea soli]|uniref:LysR family transcriptional regulator n=1 Tax=Chryseolinea soli TaxID=2321403 RepID=A0A385SSP7_9BACT|nr:LysR family transcriptional regulator [Chryseolinea soli]AYB33566.1 LysR family transcriptional regulator [Chryseolinea soli]
MTTDQLKNFLAVAEVLNFHKASSSMYIAQPALSRQIKNLEEEIGAELFDRTKKQIRLTAAGVFFKNEVTRILKHLGQAQKKAGQIHRGEAGEIMIGHVSSAMYSVLPYFLKTITTSYPHLKIGLLENSCNLIFAKILDRELQFGIVPNEVGPDGIGSAMLYKENFVVVMPKNLKVNLKKKVDLKTLANADWILPAREDGQVYHDLLSGIFQKNGFAPRVVFQSPNASTNLRMVSEGLGVTIIAKSAVKGVNLNIKYFELTDISEKVEMRFVWSKEREEELNEYRELFLKIFREIRRT